MLFRHSNSEDEIYSSMEKNLLSSFAEKKHNFGKLERAISCLNSAAELFEKAGMQKEAEAVLLVIRKMV